MFSTRQSTPHGRRINRPFDIPRRVRKYEAVPDGVFGEAGKSRKLRHRERFTAIDKSNIGADVVRLILASRPAAIAGLVPAIIVDAVKRHPGRSLSHVRKEVGERAPSIAYGDSSFFVMQGDGIAVLGAASAKHVDPRSVGRALLWLPVIPFGVSVGADVVSHENIIARD